MDTNLDATPKSPSFELRNELKSYLPILFKKHLVKSKTPKEQRFGLIQDLTTFFNSKGYTSRSMPVHYWVGGVKREGRLDLAVFHGQTPLLALVVSREFNLTHLLKLQAAFSLRMLPVAIGLNSSQFSAIQALSAQIKLTEKFPWWLLSCTPFAFRSKTVKT